MTMDRSHEPFEQLISASLSGDLTASERDKLDAHLDTCAACRQTLASFAEQRRIMAGLRHVPPPRDLNARIRTGIERGSFAPRPWWRRPAVIFAGVGGGLAAVAGALLAVVILAPDADAPPVGDASATPSSSATVSAAPSASGPPASLAPSASPPESVAPPTPHPTPPAAIGWGAVNYLQWEGTLASQELTLRGWDPATQTSAHLLNLDDAGQPVAAVLSPNAEWLAYQVPVGQKGTNEIVVVHLPTGDSFPLGETPDGSVFSERMTWSPDSRYLAYTVGSDDDRGTGPDAWAFDTQSQVDFQLTFTYATYAASFTSDGLWVSVAGEEPVSHLIDVELTADGPLDLRGDGAGLALGSQDGVFLPILSPDGEHAIFWRGRMADVGGAWSVSEGGMLYLSGEPVDGQPTWSGEPLFPELTVDRDALASAGVAWSFDSDRFAVWGVQWQGVVQDPDGASFPNDHLVYLGGAEERQLITADSNSLALVDPQSGQRPVDVTFVDIDAIAVTIFETPAGESGESPVAGSRLIISPLGGTDGDLPQIGPDVAWVGPALYVPQGDE